MQKTWRNAINLTLTALKIKMRQTPTHQNEAQNIRLLLNAQNCRWLRGRFLRTLTVCLLVTAASGAGAAWATAATANVRIVSPANGATVQGSITIATSESAGVSWINVYVDGVWVASNSPTAPAPYSVTWNSTSVANGQHSVSVKGYDNRNDAVASGKIGVDVLNLVAPQKKQPAPTATPPPARTATPQPSQTPTVQPTQTAAPQSSQTGTPQPTQSASPQPTQTATPQPTPTTGSSSPSPAPTSTPATAAYYVAPSSSDSNSGSASAPWRTIKHAVSLLRPGQQAMVAAGTYNERVTISSSGTAGLPIVLQGTAGADVKLLGFTISGDYWTVSGFDISTQTNNSSGYGIYLTGSATYDTVQNNYIHELCHEGVYMESTVSHISVIGKPDLAGRDGGDQHRRHL
jgi:Bacterial Ig domain/Protein of unknown function (DUF1565)